MTISLAAIEAADKAATPGEWHSDGLAVSVPGEPCIIGCDYPADAEAIALYRNGTPALVAALRAVLALADDLAQQAAKYRTDAQWFRDRYHEDDDNENNYLGAALTHDGQATAFEVASTSVRKAITDAGVEP